jgi:hypothetical protein
MAQKSLPAYAARRQEGQKYASTRSGLQLEVLTKECPFAKLGTNVKRFCKLLSCNPFTACAPPPF